MTLVLLYDGIKVGAVKESGLTIHVPPALVLGVAALEFTEPLFPPNPGNKEILCNVWNNYSLVVSRRRVPHGIFEDALGIQTVFQRQTLWLSHYVVLAEKY
jgi:hypothetical protein